MPACANCSGPNHAVSILALDTPDPRHVGSQAGILERVDSSKSAECASFPGVTALMALYEGTTLVGPLRMEKKLGFSPYINHAKLGRALESA